MKLSARSARGYSTLTFKRENEFFSWICRSIRHCTDGSTLRHYTHCCACSGLSNVINTVWVLASRELTLSQCCTLPYCDSSGSMLSNRTCRGSPLMRTLDDRLREAITPLVHTYNKQQSKCIVSFLMCQYVSTWKCRAILSRRGGLSKQLRIKKKKLFDTRLLYHFVNRIIMLRETLLYCRYFLSILPQQHKERSKARKPKTQLGTVFKDTWDKFCLYKLKRNFYEGWISNIYFKEIS